MGGGNVLILRMLRDYTLFIKTVTYLQNVSLNQNFCFAFGDKMLGLRKDPCFYSECHQAA